MKKIIFLYLFLILLTGTATSQFSNPVRLTTGNSDRNPSFDHSTYNIDFAAFDFEYMIFERADGNSSQICLRKIDSQGPFDSEMYLTNDAHTNKNPAISYNPPVFSFGDSIKYALAVWQSNKFGHESIFGSSFNVSSGWSEPFILDSSAAGNRNPDVIHFDSLNFGVTYECGNDIKYLKYNILSGIISARSNLTSADPGNFSNPHITKFNNGFNNPGVAISLDKEISVNEKAIYCRIGIPDSMPQSGYPGDTIAYSGNNRTISFGRSKLSGHVIYETNRNGNIDIYTSEFYPTVTHTQNPVVIDNTYDNLYYKGSDIPITDNSVITNYVYSYFRKSGSDLKLIAKAGFTGTPVIFNISDNPLYHSSLSLNNMLRVPNMPALRLWFVYNKDSLDINFPSTIYGYSYTVIFTDIKTSSSNIANDFSLSQNYPNPFNPKTIINYELRVTDNVKIKVFDVLGNEVAELVNEKQNAGSYSVEFDGSGFASGIYFYSLYLNGSLFETKRMVMLK
ncbi:MAG: T9SS type A sorting domain-containing protein [Ignavibacteria bacterium]